VLHPAKSIEEATADSSCICMLYVHVGREKNSVGMGKVPMRSTARYIRRHRFLDEKMSPMHRFFGDFFSSAGGSLALGSGPPANARACRTMILGS